MKKNSYVSCFLPAVISLASCNNSGGSNPSEKYVALSKLEVNSAAKPNADSIALTKLIRDLYKWHENSYRSVGFPFKGNLPNDTIFTGIDWVAYNKEAEILKKTNFFAQQFLERHRAIAATIDSSIRKAPLEWRNFNDGIPLWSTDADDWCGCQDSPDNYWERLKINQLKVNNNTATFNWAWGKEDGIDPPFKYNMRAKKENGVWKISYMDGFSYYGTVAYYDSRMNPQKQ